MHISSGRTWGKSHNINLLEIGGASTKAAGQQSPKNVWENEMKQNKETPSWFNNFIKEHKEQKRRVTERSTCGEFHHIENTIYFTTCFTISYGDSRHGEVHLKIS
jgi:hypothetical protein